MEQTQKIRFRKTRDFGQVISDTFAFLRQNYKKLGKSLLIIAGPVAVLGAIFGGLYQADVLSLAASRGEGARESALGIGIEALLLIFFSTLSTAISTAVVYEYVTLYINNDPDGFDVPDVWEAVKQDFFMILITVIVQAILITIGMVFLFIPGIYLAIALSLAIMIRVQERVGLSEALTRSPELIKGNWWRTAGILIVTLMIASTVSGILYVPQYIIMLLSFMHNTDSDGMTAAERMASYRIPMIIAAMLPQLGAFFLYSFPALAVSFQYFNLVEQKEGAGLLERIEEFGTPSDTNESYDDNY